MESRRVFFVAHLLDFFCIKNPGRVEVGWLVGVLGLLVLVDVFLLGR